MIEDYDNVDFEYAKEWDIEQYKKEIERLKNQLEEKTYLYNKLSTESEYVIERLHSIIKEVREYIEKNYDDYEEFIYGKEFKEKVLEILDKENI